MVSTSLLKIKSYLGSLLMFENHSPAMVILSDPATNSGWRNLHGLWGAAGDWDWSCQGFYNGEYRWVDRKDQQRGERINSRESTWHSWCCLVLGWFIVIVSAQKWLSCEESAHGNVDRSNATRTRREQTTNKGTNDNTETHNINQRQHINIVRI